MEWLRLLKTDLRRNTQDHGLRSWRRFEFLKVFLYPSLQTAALYRLSHALHTNGFGFFAQMCHGISMILTGADIHPAAEIGEELLVVHPVGLVIGKLAKLGSHVTVASHVGIGRTEPSGPMPVVGNNVFFGANASAMGPITVGDNSFIGAHVLLVKDVPADAVVSASQGEVRSIKGIRQVSSREKRLLNMEAQLAVLATEQENVKILLRELAEKIDSGLGKIQEAKPEEQSEHVLQKMGALGNTKGDGDRERSSDC